ncbi:hypothetical protein [Pseudomonas phage Almagne]|nr:hypothetical protein [Pseudomonas phage Almagne]
MVEGYVSRRFPHHTFSYGWDADLARRVLVNPKRAAKRVASYVDYTDLARASSRAANGKDFSIRFGVEKTGSGNFGERGDFCLLGASYTVKGRTLTLHYRSLELFGGLVYDQAILLEVIGSLELDVKRIVVMCGSCHSFALKGNSNEKLYRQLLDIYGTPRRKPRKANAG